MLAAFDRENGVIAVPSRYYQWQGIEACPKGNALMKGFL